MRCQDCNKFVSYGEPNTDNLEVELENGSLTLRGELTLTCGECGTDLASCSVDAEENVSDLFDRNPDESAGETAIDLIEDEPSYEPTDRTEDKDRHGKPIKNPRYAKRFYGVEATVTIRRTILDRDGKEVHSEDREVTIAAEEQASSFETLS
jgi:hypothetical protein